MGVNPFFTTIHAERSSEAIQSLLESTEINFSRGQVEQVRRIMLKKMRQAQLTVSEKETPICVNRSDCVAHQTMQADTRKVQRFGLGFFHCCLIQNEKNKRDATNSKCYGGFICLACGIDSVEKREDNKIVCTLCNNQKPNRLSRAFFVLEELWSELGHEEDTRRWKATIPVKIMDILGKSDLARLGKALLSILFDTEGRRPAESSMVVLRDPTTEAGSALQSFITSLSNVFASNEIPNLSKGNWSKIPSHEEKLLRKLQRESGQAHAIEVSKVGEALFKLMWGAFEDHKCMRVRTILHSEFWFLLKLLNPNLTEEQKRQAAHRVNHKQKADPTQPMIYESTRDAKLNPLLYFGPDGGLEYYIAYDFNKLLYWIVRVYMLLNFGVPDREDARQDTFQWTPPEIGILEDSRKKCEELATMLQTTYRKKDPLKEAEQVAKSVDQIMRCEGALARIDPRTKEVLQILSKASAEWVQAERASAAMRIPLPALQVEDDHNVNRSRRARKRSRRESREENSDVEKEDSNAEQGDEDPGHEEGEEDSDA